MDDSSNGGGERRSAGALAEPVGAVLRGSRSEEDKAI